MRRVLILAGIVAAICVVAGMARTQQIRDAALKAAALRYVENGHGVPCPCPAQSTHAALKALPRRADAAPRLNLEHTQQTNQQSQTQATPMEAVGQRAQVPQAKVTLVIRDQSGAAIPGADVRIEPIGITLRTDRDGAVSVALPLATYELVVSDSGFSVAKERVIVREPAAQTVDVVLKLGPTGSPIVLTAPLPPRKVAITFDDLPAFSSDALNGTQIVEQNERLLGTLQREKIPAIGFVNAAKLYKWGQVDERIKALQIWLDDGFELGNHTYSHESLNRVGLKAWEENVVEGEPLLKLLLAQHGMTLRYYRPPYLDMGADLLTRRQAEQFLASRGYRVAPITIDVGDWEFAPIYFAAKQKGDTAEESRVVSAFLDYANASLDYAEKFSKQIIGYEPTQVILLHDSELEADHFAELAALMRKRNYSFITLDDALDDSAYSLPNDYAGGGTSWLDQWAITEGKMPPNEPALPEWLKNRLADIH